MKFKVGQKWRTRTGLFKFFTIVQIESTWIHSLAEGCEAYPYYHNLEGRSCLSKPGETHSEDLFELMTDVVEAPKPPMPTAPKFGAARPAARLPVKPLCECAMEKHRFMFHERWCPTYEHPFVAAARLAAPVPAPDYRTDGDRRAK